MQKSMLPLNNVQTQVISLGRWVEESFPQAGKKDVVIVIPGNPGIPEFYEGFISSVKSKIPSEIPIWIVGQAGHMLPPEHLGISMPSDEEWDQYYGLTAQVKHKIKFIKTYVPNDGKIYLIGHSIGSWIILNLLKDEDISKRVEKCYLLFPTIENMADTWNGKMLTFFILYIANLMFNIFWILSFLPNFFQKVVMRIFFICSNIPAKFSDTILLMLEPRILKRVFKLTEEELKVVKELDHNIIEQHAHKLWLYYSIKDHWTPIKFYENMKAKHPNVETNLCEHNFPHDFVLYYDKEMGEMIGNLINENISKY